MFRETQYVRQQTIQRAYSVGSVHHKIPFAKDTYSNATAQHICHAVCAVLAALFCNSLSQLSFATLFCSSLVQLSRNTELRKRVANESCERMLQKRALIQLSCNTELCIARELNKSSLIQLSCKRAAHEVSGKCAAQEVSALLCSSLAIQSKRAAKEMHKRVAKEICIARELHKSKILGFARTGLILKDLRALVQKDSFPNHKFFCKLDRIFRYLMTEMNMRWLR